MGQTMAKLKLRYVNEYIDRTGKLRRYFRRGGKQLCALPGEVGSEEFMTAYAACLVEKRAAAKCALHADSLGKLIIDFYGDRMFTDRKPSTRQLYRYALEPLAREHGHRSAALMTAEHAEKIINKIGANRPGMGNLTRAVLRLVMKFAVKNRRRKDNPLIGTEAFKVGEHHTWNDAELKQFETKWRLGTRQRLAYALLLYTGQRVGDVAKMNRADISQGMILVVQEKTGAEVWVPIHHELQRAMKACPAKGLSLIGKENGQPLKRAALSALMRAAIKDAELPKRCVSHGLRKAMMRRLAESDATAKQIAGISGHKTLKEIERYTKAADQKKLAIAAMDKLRAKK
jgi:enterobacteria phage integrase